MSRKSRNITFSNDLWAGRLESRLAQAAGAEPCGQMRKEQLHTAVARSTFPSQNAQNTSASNHSWKLGCPKMRCGGKHVSKSKGNKTNGLRPFLAVRMSKFPLCCGKNHILKSRCAKHTTFRPLLEVQMLKNGTRLWREAHFQVKISKKHKGLGTTFGRSDESLGPLLEG